GSSPKLLSSPPRRPSDLLGERVPDRPARLPRDRPRRDQVVDRVVGHVLDVDEHAPVHQGADVAEAQRGQPAAVALPVLLDPPAVDRKSTRLTPVTVKSRM